MGMFSQMLRVAQSNKKVQGSVPEPSGGYTAGKKGGKESSGKKGSKEKPGLSEELRAQYEEAVNSAKTKFDHCDVFFAKDKNPMGFIKMIATEAVNDIKVDKTDTKAMKEHEGIVRDLIMPDFQAWKKAQAQS